MADGNMMRAASLQDTKAISLEDAISRLESGQGEDLTVDLGNGRIATADGSRGTEGLLQRLRGHSMMPL